MGPPLVIGGYPKTPLAISFMVLRFNGATFGYRWISVSILFSVFFSVSASMGPPLVIGGYIPNGQIYPRLMQASMGPPLVIGGYIMA